MPTRSSSARWSGNDGLDDAEFQKYADGAKSGCAVSRALGGVEIALDAKLV